MFNATKYIFFDLDGTVTDPKVGITKSVAYALNYFGISVTDTDSLVSFIGPPLKNSFMTQYNFDENTATIAISKYREYYADKGIYENALYEGITELLETLKNNNKTIVLATSKPIVFANKILKHFNIYDYFYFISGSELDGRRENKSEVIKYALTQNSITDISNVVMVGDRKHDIIGARESNISSIGVLYGYGSYEELNSQSPDMIVKDIPELTKAIM